MVARNQLGIIGRRVNASLEVSVDFCKGKVVNGAFFDDIWLAELDLTENAINSIIFYSVHEISVSLT